MIIAVSDLRSDVDISQETNISWIHDTVIQARLSQGISDRHLADAFGLRGNDTAALVDGGILSILRPLLCPFSSLMDSKRL